MAAVLVAAGSWLVFGVGFIGLAAGVRFGVYSADLLVLGGAILAPIVAGLAVRRTGSGRTYAAALALGSLPAAVLVGLFYSAPAGEFCLYVPRQVVFVLAAPFGAAWYAIAAFLISRIARPSGSAGRLLVALVVGLPVAVLLLLPAAIGGGGITSFFMASGCWHIL